MSAECLEFGTVFLHFSLEKRTVSWAYVNFPFITPKLSSDAALGHRVCQHVPRIAPQHVTDLLGAELVRQPP